MNDQIEALKAHYKKQIISYIKNGDKYSTGTTDHARCCEIGFILKNIFGVSEEEEQALILESQNEAKKA